MPRINFCASDSVSLSLRYSPLLKKSIGLGYIHNHDGIVDKEYVMNAEYKINILNEGFKATPSLSPLYDPKMEKVKA